MEKENIESKVNKEDLGKTKEELAAERKKRKEEKAEGKQKNKEKKEKEVKKETKPEKKVEVKSSKENKVYESNAKLIRSNKGEAINVDENKRNILITSALPYVNNEPHLGNIIGCVLSADVFARYSRQMGYNTLYVCGTDEYGTATETTAVKEKCTPKELCDKFHALHSQIYEWFDIDFDNFGRTPTEVHSKITLDIFNKLKNNGNIKKEMIKQYKCEKCNIFLADRYIYGTCHYESCKYPNAGGDQCDQCGKLIVATELIDAKCKLCDSTPILLDSYHYYINLPKIEPELHKWLEVASKDWSKNSVNISKGFLTEGLKPRCITRDLKWGVQVPCEDDKDLENKVFYVWFDAPIGYISITANLVEKWEEWWKNPENIKLYQFMGKDNVTFHTIIFPSSLLGTNEKYTLVNNLSTTEYLNYEGVKFSKRNGVGVFGSHAKETGIPSEVWRFYLLSIRPEQGDTDFYWDKFAETTTTELINKLGNLYHRAFSFVNSKFKHIVPHENLSIQDLSFLGEEDLLIIEKIYELFFMFIDSMEKVKIKESLEIVMKIASEGNNYLQKMAPWDVYKKDVERCKVIMVVSTAIIRLIALIAEPFIPSFSAKVYEIMNVNYSEDEKLLGEIASKKDNFKESFISLAFKIKEFKEAAPLFAPSKTFTFFYSL